MNQESTKLCNPSKARYSKQVKNIVKINTPTHIYSFLSTVMVSNEDLVDNDDMDVE